MVTYKEKAQVFADSQTGKLAMVARDEQGDNWVYIDNAYYDHLKEVIGDIIDGFGKNYEECNCHLEIEIKAKRNDEQ